LRHNPVVLLNFILDLDTDALNAIVGPAIAFTFANIRTGAGRRTEAYPTSGENITMPIAQVKTLEARATSNDAIVEANRVAYEASRSGGVTAPPGKWCLAAGVKQSELDYRHANHLCYFCGEHVKNGNVIVHTFWHCPKRLLVHDKVEEQMARSGSHAPSDRRGPTQRESNEKRRQSSGSAHQDADQDQSFRRNPSRDSHHQQWGREPHPVPHGQERGFDGQASPRRGSRNDEQRNYRRADDSHPGERRSGGRDTRDSRRDPPQDDRRDQGASGGRGNGRDRSSRRNDQPSRDPSQDASRGQHARAQPSQSRAEQFTNTRHKEDTTGEGAPLASARGGPSKKNTRFNVAAANHVNAHEDGFSDDRSFSSGSDDETQDNARSQSGDDASSGNDQ